MKMLEKYRYLSNSKLEDSKLIINIRYWPENHLTSLSFYNAALLNMRMELNVETH